MDIILPEWLIGRDWLIGFEGDDDGSSGDDDGNSDGDDPTDDDDDDTDDEGDDDEDDDDDSPSTLTRKDVQKLQDSLKAARRDARIAKREARLAAKNANTKAKTEKADELEGRATAAESKLERIAERFKQREVQSAARDIARELKFRDPEDALAEIAKFSDDDLGVDQDPDEPADVEVDKDIIREKLKALADRKKYLIDTGSTGEPTGSSFSGGKGGNNKKANEQRLLETYSGLR